MMHSRKYGLFLTLSMLPFLAGCFGMGNTPPPKSPSEALAAADIHFQGLVETAGSLARQHILVGHTAKTVEKDINKGDAALKAAWAALEAGQGYSTPLQTVQSVSADLTAALTPLIKQMKAQQLRHAPAAKASTNKGGT